jgi:GDP-4-dehydro-6-deoxy-D-mannose reductase
MVGNLTKRAIVDVRDLVRGLWMSADHCQFGDVYNLGATRIYPIQEVIDSIRAKTNVPFSIESDPALVRGCDELVIAGDITKFQQRTGWAPEVSLETTLQDMLDWWRKKLSVKEPSRTVTTAAFRQLSSTPEPASV